MRVLFRISIAFFIGVFVLAFLLTRAPASTGEKKEFIVMPGEDVHAIGVGLKSEGLIRSTYAFDLYTRFWHPQAKILAGHYLLSASDNLFGTASVLFTGEVKPAESVTLIEGWSDKEYRSYLAKRGFDAAAFDAIIAGAATWRASYPFLSAVPAKATLEGYLFPDTYAVSPDKNVRTLVIKMLNNFDAKLTDDMRRSISDQKRSIHQAITLASIVELEVPDTNDRRMVSDIFYRRLSMGMPLQSDATINYITGSGRARSTAQDLASNSLYNTYKYPGLPPGPIGNPGLDAIRAVINPLKNDYLYFLTDKNGLVHYAKTFKEHQKNITMYL